ncbi:MAG: serine hydrolase [Planctomycetes bacterium]|nr:serine hydrolase [Planctomycetota bacterium]
MAQAAHLPGQVIVNPANPAWLVYNRDDNRDGRLDPFFLSGPGGPEGFLYRGRRLADGTRDGDQAELIGKLARYGGNCIYLMAVRTHGGDSAKESRQSPTTYPDALHNPWIHQDPAQGLNHALLDQWEEWFTLMDKHGIVIYFFIYDDAIKIGKRLGWPLDQEGNLHPGERAFVTALVNRFEHHRSLIWCVMEEAQEIGPQWQRHTSKIAEAIAEADDHDHVIASHQLGGNVFFHADDPIIDQFAIQTRKDQVETIPAFREWMLDAWRKSGSRFNLNMSEDARHHELVGQGERAGTRHRSWVAAMSGAYVMCFGIEIADTPPGFMTDCRKIQAFFEATEFQDMAPDTDRPLAGTRYLLASPHHSYIAYALAPQGGKMGIANLPAGRYVLTWFDCVAGSAMQSGHVQAVDADAVWRKPAQMGDEVALYVRNLDAPVGEEASVQQARVPRPDVPAQKAANAAPSVSDQSVQTKQDQPVYIQLTYEDLDGGPGPYTIVIVDRPTHGQLTGEGNDKTYTPAPGFSGRDAFRWKVNDGAGDSPTVRVTVEVTPAEKRSEYFPPADAAGGWRTLSDVGVLRAETGMLKSKLDEAFEYVQSGTKNGGLLVVRRGWMVYERYFGKGHRDALCNLGSCGKPFTSVAMGILMGERPELFPAGLGQKVYTPTYLPAQAFPLPDPRMADVTLGQMLTFTAGIRGNNPCYVKGKEVSIDPVGPDGWQGLVDDITLGRRDTKNGDTRYSAATLWCDPGGGYSYATASIHNVSIMLRHVTGMEMQDYIGLRLAEPLGWGRWTFAYKHAVEVTHTPGGGGIALRATDMLRFGYMLLNEGRWGDRQVVPAAYVRHCGQKSPWNPHYPYSLQFQVNSDGGVPELPTDAFWKAGSGYHCLYVVPSQDLVVWKLGGRDHQYSSGNTGMPVLSHVKAAEQDRSAWKRTVDPQTAYTETLRLVLEAIGDQ